MTPYNDWGTYELTVYEQATEDEGERWIRFKNGSSVPSSVTEIDGETIKRSVYYRDNGLINIIEDNNGDANAPEDSRRIYYTDDGLGMTVKTNDDQKTSYSLSHLEPFYAYSTEFVEYGSEGFRFIYRDNEGNTIETDEYSFCDQ